jgi:hypothetical protein
MLSWENDCLVVDMQRQKSDETGERTKPKHVFANHNSPWMCPILSLALHVFSATNSVVSEDLSAATVR